MFLSTRAARTTAFTTSHRLFTTGASLRNNLEGEVPLAMQKQAAAASAGTSNSDIVKEAKQFATPESTMGAIGRELHSEMATSLGRCEDRIELGVAKAKSQLERVLELRMQGADECAVEAEAVVYRQHRKDAVSARNDLMIQREMMGMRIHNLEFVQANYPLPPKMDDRGCLIVTANSLQW